MTTNASQSIDTAIKIGMVALLTLWCFQIAKPFIGPIVWGGIIAIAAYPLFTFVQNKTGFGNGLSSTIVTLALLGVLITPTVMLTELLVENVQSVSGVIKEDGLKIPPPPDVVGNWPLIGEKLETFWNKAHLNPKETLGQYAPEIKKSLNWLLSQVASTGLSLLVFVFSIIIAGVFMASAKGAKQSMETILIRMAGQHGTELTKLSHDTVQSVVRGILGIAVLQTLLAAAGFIVMDIPASALIAMICLVLAIVQIDILIVLIPLSIMAFYDPDTSTFAAVVFLVWNVLVGLMNNVLKPILLAKGVEAPMAVIFIGAIGGMLLSGIIGLFVGAVVMVLGYTLFMAWIRMESPSTS